LRFDLGGITAVAPRSSRSFQEPISIKGFISQQCAKGNVVYQWSPPFHVVCLPRQKQKAKQVPERIDHANYFGRQPTARAPDGLMLGPPFAPDAF
jgi:hypothetical protein